MRTQIERAPDRRFAVDTTFVLFFLALDLGMSYSGISIDSALAMVTIAAFVVLPYLLPAVGEKPQFALWAAGRTLIALFAVILGAVFSLSLGDMVPEAFKYLPMTLLIVAAMASCYMQFFTVFKLRLAK